MSFKSDVDAEAKNLIEKGVAPMEALKQAVRIVSEKMSAEVNQFEDGLPTVQPSPRQGKGPGQDM